MLANTATSNTHTHYINRLTAKCWIYPAQQEYCVRQLPDISGDICLDYIGNWRQEYFVSGVYNLKKFDFDQKTPGVGTIFHGS